MRNFGDKNLQTFYDKYHRNTTPQKRIVDEKNFTYRLLLGIIKPQLVSKKRILDLGCGVGTLSFYVANKGILVDGVDISKKAIEVCKLTAKRLGLERNTDFWLLDFSKKSAPEKFDLVLCLELLEHLENDELAIGKIFDNLKEEGIVMVSTPSKNAPLYRLGLMKGFDKRVGHLRRYTMEELTSLLKDASLKIVETRKTEGIFRNFLFYNRLGRLPLRLANRFWLVSDIFTFIDNITLKLFGESQLIIVAQKPKIKGK